MKFSLFAALPLFFLNTVNSQNLASHVNPFIGTGGHGHTFPGAVLPFGMVQLSPDTRIDGSWDGCSGYHFSDDTIYGFSHTHLSGTGVSDWGDILLMPMMGEPSMDPKKYASAFSHKNEKASAGFYEVLLDDDKVKVELTATPRVGIHKYTFPSTGPAQIILDLLHRDRTLDCWMEVVDSVTVRGYRISEAWAKKQYVYFAMKFSQPHKFSQVASGRSFIKKFGKFRQRYEGAFFRFDTLANEPLMIKVGISAVSVEGAMKNLETEAPHWDFTRYKKMAESEWNKQLQKVEIKENNKDKAAIFYTALYHCFIHPSLNMDVDNQYRGRDNKIHAAEGFTNYTVFSLWDTYRALHPLFTILERRRTADFINSFLNQYQQAGRLPVWELSGNETNCMIGFHSVSVIADAMVKNIEGFDTQKIYEAMKAAAEYTDRGIPVFNKRGYLQIEDESESVSKSLEYAYDNWCIAQAAKFLNRPEDERFYLQRSLAYKHLFDPSTGNMRPRKNGNWLSPFSPSEINNHFTEGNSWHYSFYAPHDIQGLIDMHGGISNFEKKLDELFTTNEKNTGRDQADVTGLIGQYAHGNEPSHHMAWLYNFAGKPEKSIEKTHFICNNFYKNAPDGLIGNEDCGQMSAWYVFAAMGMYPVCPGQPEYVLGEPLFKQVKLIFEAGKSTVITADPSSDHAVNGVLIDGGIKNTSFLLHNSLVGGGKIDFQYGALNDPKNNYGRSGKDIPVSAVNGVTILPAPLIISPSQVFRDKLEVTISPLGNSQGLAMYTVDGKEPTNTPGSQPFLKAIPVDSNCTIKAKWYAGDYNSAIAEARFYKLKYDYYVSISSSLHPQYRANGTQSLVDGIHGSVSWQKGDWLGVQGQDFQCVVDLKMKKEISVVGLECLQDVGSWILFPTEVSFFASDDNVNYKLLETVKNSVGPEVMDTQIQNFEKQLPQKVSCRYIKIVAKNYGKLPGWHAGKGGDAYVFTDELKVE